MIRKLFLLALLSLFFCAPVLAADNVSIKVKKAQYDLIPGVALNVDLEVINNSSSTIYFQDPACNNPVVTYQKVKNKWVVKNTGLNACLGLAYGGPPTPSKLEPGKSGGWQEYIDQAGEYRLEFRYSYQPDIYQKGADQKVLSKAFKVVQIKPTVANITKACAANKKHNAECLDLAAKSRVTVSDTDAIKLCRLTKWNGCFGEVAWARARWEIDNNKKTNKPKALCGYLTKSADQKSCIKEIDDLIKQSLSEAKRVKTEVKISKEFLTVRVVNNVTGWDATGAILAVPGSTQTFATDASGKVEVPYSVKEIYVAKLGHYLASDVYQTDKYKDVGSLKIQLAPEPASDGGKVISLPYFSAAESTDTLTVVYGKVMNKDVPVADQVINVVDSSLTAKTDANGIYYLVLPNVSTNYWLYLPGLADKKYYQVDVFKGFKFNFIIKTE